MRSSAAATAPAVEAAAAVARRRQNQQIRRAAAAAAAAVAAAALQAAAWQLVALLPRLTAVIHSFIGRLADCDRSWLLNTEACCGNLAASLQLLHRLHKQPATAEQLVCWAAAATDGLRLQPALLQLQASLQQIDERPADGRAAHDGPQQLSAQLVRLCELMFNLQQPSSVTEQRGAATALWQLHSTHTRLCHWLLSRDSPALAGTLTGGSAILLMRVMTRLLCAFQSAANALEACRDPGGQGDLSK